MTVLSFMTMSLIIRNIFNVEKLYRLFRLQCEDLLVLTEMEYNGMLFDTKGALQEANQLEDRLDELSLQFKTLVHNHAVDINSGKHISAVLYGGVIEETVRVACGVYKSGNRRGEVKYRNEKLKHTFERLVEPLDKTETKRSKTLVEEGKKTSSSEWSVKEDVLKKLKAKKFCKQLIAIILEYRELYKLKSTYLEGWSNLITFKGWNKDMIYGKLNQCNVVTGRLSSNKPNLQNCDKKTKRYLISRYD